MNVIFRKNTFPFFSQKKEMAIDCHFHSTHSDGSAKIKTILREAKKKNIGVAITDHNEIRGVLEAYKNNLGVPVIPGIEVSCKGMMHLLIYFYEVEHLKDFFECHIKPFRRIDHNIALKKMTALKIAKLAKQYNCLTIIAHPYSSTQRDIDSYMKMPENIDFFSYVDGVEGINGTKTQKTNQKAIHLAHDLQKPAIGGSDGHTITALGKVLTIGKADTIAEFLDAVKHGKTTISGKKVSVYQLSKNLGTLSYKHFNVSTKKHGKEILTTIGALAIFQRLSIAAAVFLGTLILKKWQSKKQKK